MIYTFNCYLLKGSVQRLLVWDTVEEEAVLLRQLELDSKFIWDFEWLSSTRLSACSFDGEIIICHIGRTSPIKRINQVTNCKIIFYLIF
jgi:hypothetical protein